MCNIFILFIVIFLISKSDSSGNCLILYIFTRFSCFQIWQIWKTGNFVILPVIQTALRFKTGVLSESPLNWNCKFTNRSTILSNNQTQSFRRRMNTASVAGTGRNRKLIEGGKNDPERYQFQQLYRFRKSGQINQDNVFWYCCGQVHAIWPVSQKFLFPCPAGSAHRKLYFWFQEEDSTHLLHRHSLHHGHSGSPHDSA